MSRSFKKAMDAGDVAKVREMLAEQPLLASSPISWGTVLCPCKTEPPHYVSDAPFNQLWDHGKQVELTSILIDAGAPVNGLPDAGETPLHGAASLGEAGVAKVLIDRGANIEAIAKYPGIPDGTPLDFAVHFGMVDVIDLLVHSGAKILSARVAAGAGQLERVRNELPVLEKSTHELHDVFRCAIVCDQAEVAEWLLQGVVDVNADLDGATALHWAAWEAKPNMISLLLDKGADPSIKDKQHELTARGWAEHRRKELGPRWGHDRVLVQLPIHN